MLPAIPQQVTDVFYAGLMGFWAFLGAVMRGTTDWKNPDTKLFSLSRFGASVATALAMGQIASGVGQHLHWEPAAISALASFAGYLGPAATMQIFQKRFFGTKDDDATPPKG